MTIEYRLDGVLHTGRIDWPDDASGFVTAAFRRGGVVVGPPPSA
jgi:hypothetical protein